MIEKPCSKCLVVKPVESFNKDKTSHDGLCYWCRDCQRNNHRQWYINNTDRVKQNVAKWQAENPEKCRVSRRKIHLKRQYGLTPEQVEEMVILQEGKCKICNKKFVLCVDHCHKTGHIRGMLCKKCNAALGWYENNEKIIKEYL